jgi:H+/Cl- antiporter ClcA
VIDGAALRSAPAKPIALEACIVGAGYGTSETRRNRPGGWIYDEVGFMSGDTATPDDPLAVVSSRRYLALLILAAILGVPISGAAYWFLWAINHGRHWLFETMPATLGFATAPAWWPLPVLTVGGLLTGTAIAYLPGRGGHSPADGFRAGAPPTAAELAGVLLAALASLCFGAVVGPEGPLIALGSGLAALAMRGRPADAKLIAVVGAAGAFAAVAFLLGSPITGAFLMLEAVGLMGPRAKVVLLPGLLCSGIGFLVAVGINRWTGIGTVSMKLSDVPAFSHPAGATFLWAIGFGAGAAVLGLSIRRLALLVRPHIERRPLIMTPVAGFLVAALAAIYAQITSQATADVLFSGEESLPILVRSAGTNTVGTLLLLIVCKSLAYSVSLGSFRGGPVFPSLFIGAAAGILLSHLPGLPVTAGIAMGMGAMTAVMLRMPMTAVLLPSLLLGVQGVVAMPLAIVAVVVAFVAATWFDPLAPAASPEHGGAMTTRASGKAET